MLLNVLVYEKDAGLGDNASDVVRTEGMLCISPIMRQDKFVIPTVLNLAISMNFPDVHLEGTDFCHGASNDVLAVTRLTCQLRMRTHQYPPMSVGSHLWLSGMVP
jgi:hypothetical protein